MKIIVGLGNPGIEYEKTRHNTGFMVMDKVLEELKLPLDKKKFQAYYGIYRHKDEKILFVKPQTYMNLSGEAVLPLMKFYGASVEDLLIIHDDLDLPVGKIRLRPTGSSGGQNGMGNIINLLGTKDIKRIRVGISKNKLIDTKDYVLGRIPKEEQEAFEESLTKAKDAILYYLDHDFSMTMNKFNQ